MMLKALFLILLFTVPVLICVATVLPVVIRGLAAIVSMASGALILLILYGYLVL